MPENIETIEDAESTEKGEFKSGPRKGAKMPRI